MLQTKLEGLGVGIVGGLRICVEANPTSNLLIGDYRAYGKLPYQRLIEDGIALSLNTDDPGLFMTTLPGEFSAMYEALAERDLPHREILAWLRERIFDAEQSTFLGRHVPAGESAYQAAKKALESPRFGSGPAWGLRGNRE